MSAFRVLSGLHLLVLSVLTLWAVRPAVGQDLPDWATAIATGVVFVDANGNERFDAGEQPLAGIRVSNGRTITLTDEAGRYRIPVWDDCNIFVIKPRGYRTPLSPDMLPRFYYTHKPAGSPPSRYPGVAPTGPLPASIDFPLYPQDEPDTFRALFWADPQPRNLREIQYITHDVIEELIGIDASFGVTLGDILFDNLTLFEELNARIALIGIPWYNVIGNHDLNMDTREDVYSDETFERIFGPPYYSFDHGPVHFIALDDVIWYWDAERDRGTYHGGIDQTQLEFLRNDLALVPDDQLVVLMMHIPITEQRNRQALYRLIEQRPYCMSISGHTHYQEHVFIDSEAGWRGPKPHHHAINVTVSGSWWAGAPDERGIPHTTMRDGAPNGYSILTFDGTGYDIEFRAARFPADYQMNIMTPEQVPAAEAASTEVVVNVFGGSERSTVEMRVDEGPWITLAQSPRTDPLYNAMKDLEAGDTPPPGRKLPDARLTPHIWAGNLPEGLEPGIRLIEVRTTDMFGKTYSAYRAIALR
jgi:hypothetical protein